MKNVYLFMTMWCSCMSIFCSYNAFTANNTNSMVIQTVCLFINLMVGIYFFKRYNNS
jgi:hypothetical protein